MINLNPLLSISPFFCHSGMFPSIDMRLKIAIKLSEECSSLLAFKAWLTNPPALKQNWQNTTKSKQTHFGWLQSVSQTEWKNIFHFIIKYLLSKQHISQEKRKIAVQGRTYRHGSKIHSFLMARLKSLDGKMCRNSVGRSDLSTWKYQFLYDHWSQATLSSVSTCMGDCSRFVWVLLLTLG